MTVRSVRLDDQLLVAVDGVLDGAVAPALHTELDAALGDGVRDVVADLTGVPAVDGGGIAVLASLAHRVGAAGGLLTLHLPDGRSMAVPDASYLRAALGAPDQDVA